MVISERLLSPAAQEICDDIDNDCDDLVDDADPSVTGQTSYYADKDGDGYGAGTATLSCDVVAGKVLNKTDCNDGNASVNPASGGCDISLTDADAFLTGDGGGSDAGEFLAAAGDVNGDGYGDFLVGAYGTAPNGEGEAYLVSGPVSGASSLTTASADVYGATHYAYAGTGVAGLGDVNGDGYDDVAIGLGGPDTVAIFLGPLSGTYSSAAADSDVTVPTLGTLAAAGDVDGDGAPDLLVGFAYDGTMGTNSGVVYLVTAPTSGSTDSSSATATIYGEGADDQAGYSIEGAADFDGDGLDDVLIGAPYYSADAGENYEGAAYIEFGPVAGTVGLADADAKLVGQARSDNAYSFPKGDYAGISLGSAGDVNADGYADIVVGGDDGGWNYSGIVYLELGPPASGPLVDADAVIGDSYSTQGYLGRSVSAAGDVDADGYADVLVNATNNEDDTDAYGNTYMFLGPFSGALDARNANATLVGTTKYGGRNQIVSPAGDIDADGRDDILIGAWDDSTAGSYAGAVWLFSGSNF